MFGEIFFIYCAVAIVICGILSIRLRNPVHCVLLVLLLFVHMAAVYLTLQAEFLAAVQIVVYAGAVLVMYLFVVFLVNFKREMRLPALVPHPWVGYVIGAGLCGTLLWGLRFFGAGGKDVWPYETLRQATHTRALARELFTHNFLALEVAGVLLLVALVAALVLARKQPPPGVDEELHCETAGAEARTAEPRLAGSQAGGQANDAASGSDHKTRDGGLAR